MNKKVQCKKEYSVLVLFFLTLVYINTAQAAPRVSSDGVWTILETLPPLAPGKEVWIQPTQYTAVSLNRITLQSIFAQAPIEFSRDPGQLINIPMPDGRFQSFRILETFVMAPELAAQFPDIKTYVGQSDDGSTIRLDSTPVGFHAQIFSPQKGWIYIDPHWKNDPKIYVSYFKIDYTPSRKTFSCRFQSPLIPTPPSGPTVLLNGTPLSTGDTLRKYRLAIAAQGEYTAIHGGTISGALAAMVTTVNRVTGIYELEHLTIENASLEDLYSMT
ncbi:MAG: hypothetical protein GKR87_10700 [Kiritimatiellae bacterium]|nr:hypothetical protein [Kiritimatiellia bacterium]